MTDRVDKLRARLDYVYGKAGSAETLGPLAFWGDAQANERWLQDEINSGRVAWRSAYRDAAAGLKACEAGDLELADLLAWSAMKSYTLALEIQVQRLRPEDRGALATPAKKRGRPRGSKMPSPEKDSPRNF